MEHRPYGRHLKRDLRVLVSWTARNTKHTPLTFKPSSRSLSQRRRRISVANLGSPVPSKPSARFAIPRPPELRGEPSAIACDSIHRFAPGVESLKTGVIGQSSRAAKIATKVIVTCYATTPLNLRETTTHSQRALRIEIASERCSARWRLCVHSERTSPGRELRDLRQHIVVPDDRATETTTTRTAANLGLDLHEVLAPGETAFSPGRTGVSPYTPGVESLKIDEKLESSLRQKNPSSPLDPHTCRFHPFYRNERMTQGREIPQVGYFYRVRARGAP